MSENIKEALEYAVELNQYGMEIVTAADGTEYYDANKTSMRRLEPTPYPEPLQLNTLDSLIDYLKSGLDEVLDTELLVVVESPVEVNVYSPLDNEVKRGHIATVKSLSSQIPFGRYEGAADFNVLLQALFEDSDDRETVLNFASALKIENGSEVVDDGISQTTTVKNGVASLAKAKAPNPVTLRPYRTFAEVEQPASQFVFRINQNAQMALFEADGGKWRLEAINNIANYLKESLVLQDNITILA